MKQTLLRYITLSTYEFHSTRGNDFTFRFDFNVRFICNYLSRAVRPLKIKTDGYTKICITLSQYDRPSILNKETKTAIVWIPVTDDAICRYENMADLNERYEFYFALLELGYGKMAKTINTPVKELLLLHDTFRKGNFHNEWTFKELYLKHLGIRIRLRCVLTTFEFRLNLMAFAFNRADTLCAGTLLKTPPDEFCFSHLFRNIRIVENKLEILDHIDFPGIVVDLEKLRIGELSIEYRNTSFGEWDTTWEKRNSINEEVINRITW